MISANAIDGVRIDGNANPATTGNLVIGNLVGLDATGSVDRGNGGYGINVFDGAIATVIGGATPADGNVISGNGSVGEAGLRVDGVATAGTVIRHNRIGADGTGATAIANDGAGVIVSDAPGTDVFDNLISGNVGDGVRVTGPGAATTEVYRNLIGVDQAGTAAIGNGGDGIQVDGGASGTRVGGVGDGNVIGANTEHGIKLEDVTGTRIEANHIGTDGGATIDLGNGWVGITTVGSGAGTTTIGGIGAGEGNVIANNAVGVAIQTGSGHHMLGNSILANDGLGLDLGADGVTANDAGDGDTGPNGLLNFPEIENVQRVAGEPARRLHHRRRRRRLPHRAVRQHHR